MMWRKLEGNDPVFQQYPFIADEVPYNLIHRIRESAQSTCLISSDAEMIFAQTAGHNPWLWASAEMAEERKNAYLQQLLDGRKDIDLPGVSAEPGLAERFARLYAQDRGVSCHCRMTMEAYCCPDVIKPRHVRGSLQKATSRHVGTVAAFLAGFSEGAYGVSVDQASQIPAAQQHIDSGNLYLWSVDGEPVSMANIAHRSPRHARINMVYTPPAYRKNGYASAIVAELCAMLLAERLMPMLYADLSNPDSNNVYRNIGFVAKGKIADYKFG